MLRQRQPHGGGISYRLGVGSKDKRHETSKALNDIPISMEECIYLTYSMNLLIMLDVVLGAAIREDWPRAGIVEAAGKGIARERSVTGYDDSAYCTVDTFSGKLNLGAGIVTETVTVN